MKTINIKGKEYVPVVERIKEFHLLYPLGEISTEIVQDENRVIVKAIIKIREKSEHGSFCMVTKHQEGLTTAGSDVPNCTCDFKQGYTRTFTGHSQAEWGKGIMGGVALEVAETSAIGRALGFANIGLLDGIASADEIRKVGKVTNDDNSDVPF